MRFSFFLLAMLLVCGKLNAQTFEVLNSKTSEPIKYVAVYNSDKTISLLTDKKGRINISVFRKNDTLHFQHTAYFSKLIFYTELKSMKHKVYLDEKLVNLNEIIISANKWEQKKNEVPNKITAINSKTIEMHNPQTSADLLGISNEVFIQKSQLGGGSPMIRGFSANSVLLVIDGIRMNNAIYRSGNLQNVITIDPNILESAEIIFGPGSIIYGSDALGGVMDLHTKKVRLNSETEKNFSFNLMSRFATANNEKTIHLDVNYHGKTWGWLTSLTLSDYGDLRQGAIGLKEFDRTKYVETINNVDQIRFNTNSNVQKESAYKQLNFMQKFRYRPNDFFDINYTFSLSTSTDIPRYDRLIQEKNDQLKYSEWYYGPQFWLFNSLNLKLQKPTKLYSAAQINLAYQNIEESRFSRKFQSNLLKSQIEKVDVLTLNFDFDKSFNKKTTLFYGVEMLYNKVNSTAYNENTNTFSREAIATRYPDGGSNYYSYALYTSLKSNLSKKITFTGGARYSYIKLKSVFNDKSFFNFLYDEINIGKGDFIASLGLVYRPSESSQINFNASNGFRAPNLDDVAKVFDSTPGNIIMPNENLEPEKAYNFDLGYIQKFGELAKLNVVLFYTLLDNTMIRSNYVFNGQTQIKYDGELSNVQAIVNSGSATIYGGSISLDVLISKSLKFHTNHTYIYGTDKDNNSLRHVSPMFGNFSFIYESNELFIDCYLNYNGQIIYGNLAPTERDKPYLYALDANGKPYSPSWFTLNIKASYKIYNNIQFNAGLENILDRRYRPYSSGISATGRNFYFSLRVKI
jgi:hemoglobin/transferrin/lactoferrin receptor protein